MNKPNELMIAQSLGTISLYVSSCPAVHQKIREYGFPSFQETTEILSDQHWKANIEKWPLNLFHSQPALSWKPQGIQQYRGSMSY